MKRASVTVDGDVTGEIGPGMLILLGIHVDDSEVELAWLVRKCMGLRIFPDDKGTMNRSIVDVDGEALVVSQFTLYGNVQKGNRPSYIASARPETAEPMYDRFVAELSQALGKRVPTGRFGAMMDVALVNDGPVTIWIERPPTGKA